MSQGRLESNGPALKPAGSHPTKQQKTVCLSIAEAEIIRDLLKEVQEYLDGGSWTADYYRDRKMTLGVLSPKGRKVFYQFCHAIDEANVLAERNKKE